MKLIPAKPQSYSEIYQTKNIKFAFCNRVGNTLHQLFDWVLCRDFLNDVLIAEQTKQKVLHYSFEYDPKKQKIDRHCTHLLLKFRDEQDITNFKSNLRLLRKIEKNNYLITTRLQHVQDNIYLVETDKFWQVSTFSLHLYAFLIKAFSYSYTKKKDWVAELAAQWTTEGRYTAQFIPEFEKIINTDLFQLFYGEETVHGYKGTPNIKFLHDNTGVLTLFKKEQYVELVKTNIFYKNLQEILSGKIIP